MLSTRSVCHRTSLRSRGFSLVEVLISIVVLSIGVLGIVGLQASALQANREARLQAMGSALARELADMIQGNAAAGKLTTGNPYLLSDNGSGGSAVAYSPASYCLSVGSNCANTTAIANAEMTEWVKRVADLPGARVEICFDSAPYNTTSGLPQFGCTSTGTNVPIVIKIGWTRASLNRAGGTPDLALKPAVVVAVTAGGSGL